MALEFQFPGSSHTLASLEKPANYPAPGILKKPKPSTASVADMCNRTAGLMSVAVSTFCRCSPQRRKPRTTPRTESLGDLDDRALYVKEEVPPMSRLGNVLSKLRQRRQRPDGQAVKGTPWETHPIEAPLVDLSGHGHRFPVVYGIQEFGTNWEQPSMAYELPCPTMERQPYGPGPAHTTSVGKAEWDLDLPGHYWPDEISHPFSAPSIEVINNSPSMPSPTIHHHSNRQTRRFDGLSPLVIAPPPTTSITIARDQVDVAFAAAYLPYPLDDQYSSHVDSPVPSLSPSDDSPPNFMFGPQSLYSSSSDRSSPQPRSPISRQSTGPAPFMSRSTSSGQSGPCSLPPPTPTYLQSQRAPIDSDNIICLGPLPDNISPKHLQFQPLPKSRPAPRAPNPDGRYSCSPADPPVLIFNRDHALPVNDHRRRSADSLGSNFTVEEEARIQAQVVRNLSMLGQERVGGSGDLVHIPQPPSRRFSFEDDR